MMTKKNNLEDKLKCLPEIPHTWIILAFLVSLVILRCFGIDSFVTASISALSGWLFGVKSEQIRKNQTP